MANWKPGLGLCVVLALGLSVLPASALNEQQIQLIKDTAASICNTVQGAKGQKSEVQLQGDVKGQLNGLVGKVIDLGGSGKGSLSHEEFEGLSREATASALEGDRGCRERLFNKMFDKLSLSEDAPQWSGKVGGDGGNDFGPISCRSGEALIGLYGKDGKDVVYSIGPICAAARFGGQAGQIQVLSTGLHRKGDQVGSRQGEQPFELACPSNMIVIGSELESATFAVANSTATYLTNNFSLRCSSGLSPENVSPVSKIGTQLPFASRRPYSCPDGSAAIAIKGRAGDWIDALMIGCQKVEL
jgi:hypothetical protein